MPRMGFGIHLPNGGFQDQPFSKIVEIAQKAEKMGFKSVWVSDHLLFPSSLGSPNIYDSLSTLASLSSVTNDIRLGTSVLLPLRHPLVTASMVSTLDNMSGGRVELGIGVGWYKPEFDAVGVDFHKRGLVQEETIALLKELWTSPKVDFEGRFFKIKDASLSPKPAQKPYPPILVGGATTRGTARSSELTLNRVVKLADGWIAWSPNLEQFKRGISILKESCRVFSRDPSTIRLLADFATCVCREKGDALRIAREHHLDSSQSLVGDPRTLVKRIEEFREMGLQEIIFSIRPIGGELKALQSIQEVMSSF